MTRCSNLKCAKPLFIFFGFVFTSAFAQIPDTELKPEVPVIAADYIFPIKPGQPNELAGSMGELRNTHFHSGLDIRTNNQIGAAVLAVKGGYVARVVKSTWSYGNVMYIKHPDGNTSLYAHLDQLKGKLANHVRAEQYKRKSFEIDLRFNEGEWPVNQGDTIALSGNTGSSNGPHLHFDIRDKDMNALNPLHFAYEEIVDKTAPVVVKIALRTMTPNARINGKFGRFEFSVFKEGKNYSVLKPILANGLIGVEVLAYDKMDKSIFQFGINTAQMFQDSALIFRQVIDKITMPVTRAILNLFDYKTMKTSGHRFNKLYVDDGNPLAFYEGTLNSGYVSVGDKDTNLVISLGDTYLNFTTVKFTLKPDPSPAKVLGLAPVIQMEHAWFDDIVKISAKACKDNMANVFFNTEKTDLPPAYGDALTKVFLIDAKQRVPDSVAYCGSWVKFGVKDVVPPGRDYTYYSNFVNVTFPDSALFDTLYLKAEKIAGRKSETILIGHPHVPLMKSIKVEWLPELTYDTAKYSVYRVNGATSNMGGKWEGGKISFVAREFGEYALLADVTEPTITRITLTSTYARFRINDNLSGIKSFEATVNGQWLLMNYDFKTGILYSERLDLKTPLKGDFELKVTDNNDNVKTFKQKIL